MIVIYGVIQSVGLDDSDNRISFIGDMTVCTDGTGHSCNVAPQLQGQEALRDHIHHGHSRKTRRAVHPFTGREPHARTGEIDRPK